MKKTFIKVTDDKDGYIVGKIYPVLFTCAHSAPKYFKHATFNEDGEQDVFYQNLVNDDEEEFEGYEFIEEEMTQREVDIYNSGYASGMYNLLIKCEIEFGEEGHEDKKKRLLQLCDTLWGEIIKTEKDFFKADDTYLV